MFGDLCEDLVAAQPLVVCVFLALEFGDQFERFRSVSYQPQAGAAQASCVGSARCTAARETNSRSEATEAVQH